MKKIIMYLVLMLTLVACGSGGVTSKKYNQDNIDKYQEVYILGEKYNIGKDSLQQFIDNGWSYDEDELKGTISYPQHELEIKLSNKKKNITLKVVNKTEAEISDINSLLVTLVDASSEDFSKDDIVTLQGINFETSRKHALKLLKNNELSYDDESLVKYNFNDNDSALELHFDDNKINAIIIDADSDYYEYQNTMGLINRQTASVIENGNANNYDGRYSDLMKIAEKGGNNKAIKITIKECNEIFYNDTGSTYSGCTDNEGNVIALNRGTLKLSYGNNILEEKSAGEGSYIVYGDIDSYFEYEGKKIPVVTEMYAEQNGVEIFNHYR